MPRLTATDLTLPVRGTVPRQPSRGTGCATTRNRSSCSPATSPSGSPPTSAKEARKQPSGTRPSPATGTTWPPSPAGAASAATSAAPPTASPHWTPSAPPSRKPPGYRPCQPSADRHSPHPREWTRSAVSFPAVTDASLAETRDSYDVIAAELEFLGQRPHIGLLPPHTTVEDHIGNHPEITQSARPEVHSDELHPKKIALPAARAGRAIQATPK